VGGGSGHSPTRRILPTSRQDFPNDRRPIHADGASGRRAVVRSTGREGAGWWIDERHANWAAALTRFMKTRRRAVAVV
jgi:hypothetical protein